MYQKLNIHRLRKLKRFITAIAKNRRAWALMLVLQLPSLRALYKYVPDVFLWVIPVYLLVFLLIYNSILGEKGKTNSFQRIFSRKYVFVLLILVITVVNFLVYPIADNLKNNGKGSDQDDALIATVSCMLKGKSPYEGKTYYPSNPISPGPGWIILSLPFSHSKLYFLLIPFYIILLGLLLKKVSGGIYLSNLFVLLCLSSLAFWETMVVGSDMFAIGAAFVLCLYLANTYLPKFSIYFLLSAVFLGTVSTSRIIFLYCLFLIFLLFFKFYKTKALVYSGVSLITAVTLHYIFYLWNEKTYPPMHLLGKGSMLIPGFYKILILALAVAVLFISFKRVKNNFCSIVFYFWLCLLIPLGSVSLGDLINLRNYNFALWEGANYLVVLLPIYLTYFCLSFFENEEKHIVC